jgi:hypothetical protein
MTTALRAAALAFALAVAVPSAVFAHTMPIKTSGTLIDVMCSKGTTVADADKHTPECGLMEHCAKSGYGIDIDGEFHRFDAAGNKQAEAVFRSTKNVDHITATVEGTLESEGDITMTRLAAE